MPISFVNSIGAGGSSGTITLTPVSPTTASCFVVSIYCIATGGPTIGAPVMTGTSGWSQQGATGLNSVAFPSYVISLFVYIGYASGTPSGNMTISYSGGTIQGIAAICDQFTGIQTSSPLENAYTSGTNANSNNGISISGVAVANIGDLEYIAGAGMGFNLTAFGGITSPTSCVPANIAIAGAMGRGYNIATTTGTHTDTMAGWTAYNYDTIIAVVVVLVAQAPPSFQFLSVSEDVSIITEGLVTLPSIFWQFSDSVTVSDSIGRIIGKKESDPIPITDGITIPNIVIPKALSDTFSLTSVISKLTSRGWSETFTLLDGFLYSMTFPTSLAISVVNIDTGQEYNQSPGFCQVTPTHLPQIGNTMLAVVAQGTSAAAQIATGGTFNLDAATKIGTPYEWPFDTQYDLEFWWVTVTSGNQSGSFTINYANNNTSVNMWVLELANWKGTNTTVVNIANANITNASVSLATAAWTSGDLLLAVCTMAADTSAHPFSTITPVGLTQNQIIANGFNSSLGYQVMPSTLSAQTVKFTWTGGNTGGFMSVIALHPIGATTGASITLNDSFSQLENVQRKTARKLTEASFGLTSVIVTNRGLPAAWSDTITQTDSLAKLTALAPVESITLFDLNVGTPNKGFAESYSVIDTESSFHQQYVPYADTFTLSDTFDETHLEFFSASDAFTLLDTSSPTYDQAPVFTDALTLVDALTEIHAQYVSLADDDSVVFDDDFAELITHILAEADTLTLTEFFSDVYIPGTSGCFAAITGTSAFTSHAKARYAAFSALTDTSSLSAAATIFILTGLHPAFAACLSHTTVKALANYLAHAKARIIGGSFVTSLGGLKRKANAAITGVNQLQASVGTVVANCLIACSSTVVAVVVNLFNADTEIDGSSTCTGNIVVTYAGDAFLDSENTLVAALSGPVKVACSFRNFSFLTGTATPNLVPASSAITNSSAFIDTEQFILCEADLWGAGFLQAYGSSKMNTVGYIWGNNFVTAVAGRHKPIAAALVASSSLVAVAS